MFCQFCGAEAPGELRFCKRCGGNLNPVAEYAPARPHVSAFSVWGIGITTLLLVIGGLAVLFGFIFELSGRIEAPALAFLAIFGLLTLLGCAAMMFRLWGKLLGAADTRAPEPRLRPMFATRGSEPPPTQQLPGQQPEAFLPGPVSSVTEHTTRTFQPAYRDPRS